MRVAVCSAVYLGDVAPFLAVGRRLAERGHDVVAVLPEGFRSMVEGEPFAFHPYGLDCSPATMHADPVHDRLMRHPFRNATKLGGYWMDRAFADDADGAERSLREGFDGADVVLSHPTFASVALPVARSMGVPVVVGQLFPMMIPTARWGPPAGSESPRLPGPLNRLAWAALRRGSGLAMRDRPVNALRRRLGYEAVRGAAGFSWLEADSVVLLASQHYYGEGADDWPPVDWCGFAYWEGPPGQASSPALESFLDGGDPPVLVTLGTSAATGAGERFAAIRASLSEAGQRSVLLHGSTVDMGPLAGAPGVVPFAPMHLVLPRCSVAVVSGALGGMAAAMRAGVPVVIHPQLFDQVWNGRRVEQLGVGVHARRPADIAPAVRRILEDPGYAERAGALAARLAGEDGAGACAEAVEAMA